MPTIVDLQAGEHGCLIGVSELAVRPLSLATRLRRAFFVGCALCGAVLVSLTVADSGQSGTGSTDRAAVAATLANSFLAASTGALVTVLFRQKPLCIPETLRALYSRADLIPQPQTTILVDQAERCLNVPNVSGRSRRCIPFDQIQKVRLDPGARHLWQRYHVESIVSLFGEVVFTLARSQAKAMTGRAVVLILNNGREIFLAETVSPWRPSSVGLLHVLDQCVARRVYGG